MIKNYWSPIVVKLRFALFALVSNLAFKRWAFTQPQMTTWCTFDSLTNPSVLTKPNASQSYLNIDTILTAQKFLALMPFTRLWILSENARLPNVEGRADLRRSCAWAHSFNKINKISAINAMKKPVCLPSLAQWAASPWLTLKQAKAIGFPLINQSGSGWWWSWYARGWTPWAVIVSSASRQTKLNYGLAMIASIWSAF